MNYKKVLDNFHPFNDIFYQRCFFNSFFPIVKRFNISIIPIITNYMNLYKINEINGTPLLDIIFIPDKPLEQLISRLGFEVKKKIYSNDLLNDIKHSIINDKPVIVWIDTFYERNRNDTYLKIHLPHTLLIYGYDTLKEEFNIIEHKNFENLSYENMVIGFDDIINAYNGFIDNFDTFREVENISSYNEYYLNSTGKSIEMKNHLFNLIRRMHKYKENYYNSINALKEYKNIFEYNYGNEFYLRNISEVLLKSFNDIINSKRAEKYLYWNIFNESNSVIFCIDKIIEYWSFVRATVARYIFSSVYKEENIKISIQKLDEIFKYENRMLEILLNYPI